MELVILGSTLVTNSGRYELAEITLEEAKRMLEQSQRCYQSYVGHDSTARYLTELTGFSIPVHRKRCQLRQGQEALCFKLSNRLANNQFISFEELKQVDYQLFRLKRLKEERRHSE